MSIRPPLSVHYRPLERLAPASSDDQTLLRLYHGAGRPPDGCVASGLTAIGTAMEEVWQGHGDWRSAREGAFELHRQADWMLAHACLPLADDPEASSRAAYAEALALTRRQGFPHLLRMWNHLPQIHAEDRGLERYRHFCVGRHAAFDAAGLDTAAYPAASALGSDGDQLVLTLIATRAPNLTIENPRQDSAYHYPPQYSPRSPSFARAAIPALGDQPGPLFISGTASIVGHRSRHRGDVLAQTRETLDNLEALIAAANRRIGEPDRYRVGTGGAIKVYLRHAADRARVEPLLAAWSKTDACYLRADICRRELDIEIELILPPLTDE